jgi:hypothetical protein
MALVGACEAAPVSRALDEHKPLDGFSPCAILTRQEATGVK